MGTRFVTQIPPTMDNYFPELNSLCESAPVITIPQWTRMNSLTIKLKECMLVPKNRLNMTEEHIVSLKNLIQICKKCMNQHPQHTESISCVTESYRLLRNACVQCRQLQDILTTHEDLFLCTKLLIQTLIEMLKDKNDENLFVTLRCIMQFLGNCCTGHIKNQVLVFKIFLTVLRQLLDTEDDKLINYTSMVVHTCLSGNLDNQEIWSNQDTVEIIKSIINHTTEHDCEWGIFLIESMCRVTNSFSNVMPLLKETEKLLVLEILDDQVKKTGEDERPSSSNLQYISSDIKTLCYKIMSLLAEHEDQNPVVIVKEIEILAVVTSHHTLYPDINRDKDLLTSIIYLLDAVHKIGKQGDNLFSKVDKVADAVNIDTDHAGYGLKKELIILIGNMAYRCKPNQDLIREMNCIPLVLDQTNIDGRNPYITQWSVLAIHNICEDNNENKAVLASLKLHGLADDAEILRKYGIEAEIRDNKVVVKPPTDRKE